MRQAVTLIFNICDTRAVIKFVVIESVWL